MATCSARDDDDYHPWQGWANIANMAEEMANPQRDLPRAVILGMLVVVATYLLANVAYLAVLPAFGPGVTLATSPVAAVETATRAAEALFPAPGSLFAAVAPKIVAVLIFVSGVGSSNVTVMTGGRYLYAVAREGELPSACARLSRFQTPHSRWTHAAARPAPQNVYESADLSPLHRSHGCCASGSHLLQNQPAVGRPEMTHPMPRGSSFFRSFVVRSSSLQSRCGPKQRGASYC